MNPEQQRALLTIALYAAFADGHKADSERETIRQMAESLSDTQGAHPLTSLYQDVLLRRVSVAGAVQALSDPAHRQLAYEMAVCVCDADGSQSQAERLFLADLRHQLGLPAESVQAFESQADSVAAWAASVPAPPAVVPAAANTPLPGTGLFAQWQTPAAAAATAAAAVVASAATPAPLPVTTVRPSEADLDKSILHYAILNGALELLPQSWASMAIIPLQIKMVYAIGKAHGVELDTGHIKEFIAAAGVGLTSQYLEQFGRKLMGGMLGKALGKTAGKLGSTATGMAFSFATTYALGQLAKRYYAGGRSMSTNVLRSSYQDLLAPAKQLQTQYLPQIQQKASTLDAAQIMALVKGRGL
ncbi:MULTISPECIES: DUF533 domain-containing protein [Giesbergeria]|uniref:DUF533 domain-containing protein n=1 Tax=Giesbergeria sinuosa TaxID=80883 RepID=A0ABV9QFI7_9BURK